MSNDLNEIRALKINGKGGPLTSAVILRGEMLSGYMYPKLHRNLRRVERLRKRKMRDE